MNSSYQLLHPITSHRPNSYSISRMNNQVNRRTAHLQSSSSHLKARHLSNFHKSIRSYNTLRLAILDYGINILHLRAPSRHHRWLSWRISEEKKKSTRCERSIVSSTHKALIWRSYNQLTHSVQRTRELLLPGFLHLLSRPLTLWVSFNRKTTDSIPSLNRRKIRRSRCGCPPSRLYLKATKVRNLPSLCKISTRIIWVPTNSVDWAKNPVFSRHQDRCLPRALLL